MDPAELEKLKDTDYPRWERLMGYAVKMVGAVERSAGAADISERVLWDALNHLCDVEGYTLVSPGWAESENAR
jgi:hypothetical protein